MMSLPEVGFPMSNARSCLYVYARDGVWRGASRMEGARMRVMSRGVVGGGLRLCLHRAGTAPSAA